MCYSLLADGFPACRPSGRLILGLCLVCIGALAADPRPLEVTAPVVVGNRARLSWTPYPATVQYRILGAGAVGGPYSEEGSSGIEGFQWEAPLVAGLQFFRVEAVPMPAADLQVATLLSRVAYGPTPDELVRVRAMGPQAYVDEQLAPETIQESLEVDRVLPSGGWRQMVVTGTATASTLYVYLDAPGELHVDDVVLVAGTNWVSGVNLLRNGDFEAPLDVVDWQVSSNFAGSALTTEQSHGGTTSLKVVASAPGSGSQNAVWQVISPSLVSGQTYTLSYWYVARTNRPSDLVVRLSGASAGRGQVYSDADAAVPPRTMLEGGWARLSDLRQWHLQHALQSRRQLVEVLAQFLENHFVTQQSKSRDYLDQYYDDSGATDRHATRMEWVENRRWREALLNAQCTFRDLLRISAESPAMIIYLDTVTSRGDGTRVANENYARELFELFALGVDNGYDQSDIVEMSKVWTGWRVRLVDASREFDPFAPQSTTIVPGSTNTSLTTVSNLAGVWAFSYRTNYHNNGDKVVFAGKTVPARFGAPYTTRLYGTNTVPGMYERRIVGRSGPAGLEEAYEALGYLADLPFTQEFISVKLCRLLVHDRFEHGVYDYADSDLSEEGRLVRACMAAWDQGNPQGQMRQVLRVILESELFRSHGASHQKVKTPLEFTVSALRALRAVRADGTFTATMDGVSVSDALGRMGAMSLFNRGDPDGYPEAAPGWISAGTLAERLRFVQALCIPPGQTGRTDAGNSFCDPAGLMRMKLPAGAWSDAGAVVDLFLDWLLPGEGRANLDAYRREAIRYLNLSDSGAAESPFAALDPVSSAYDTRVRGMVAMLLSTPRFQEQ